ncbi:MAG: prepilin-type N-terminal cleavage/methylation domain-containing protein [Bradymonadales bacterium]|nr:MAG: prepilin-type N-terminal cleavage/methylation domain-containing protein [Bradymonadales bacterium]
MKVRAFTIIELLIVVVIIGVISAVSYMGISSRSALSRLESAAQVLAADVAYARTTAGLKQCQTRFVLCVGRDNCAPNVAPNVTASSGQLNARFYALLRRSHGAVGSTESCFNPQAIPAADDGFASWDFEITPKPLPRGVSFDAIYTAVPSQADWLPVTAAAAAQSIWFPTSPSSNLPGGEGSNRSRLVAVPIANPLVDGDNGSVIFQLSLTDCTGNDCPGYFVVLMNTGETLVRRCVRSGTRPGGGSDICF